MGQSEMATEAHGVGAEAEQGAGAESTAGVILLSLLTHARKAWNRKSRTSHLQCGVQGDNFR